MEQNKAERFHLFEINKNSFDKKKGLIRNAQI